MWNTKQCFLSENRFYDANSTFKTKLLVEESIETLISSASVTATICISVYCQATANKFYVFPTGSFQFTSRFCARLCKDYITPVALYFLQYPRCFRQIIFIACCFQQSQSFCQFFAIAVLLLYKSFTAGPGNNIRHCKFVSIFFGFLSLFLLLYFVLIYLY